MMVQEQVVVLDVATEFVDPVTNQVLSVTVVSEVFN